MCTTTCPCPASNVNNDNWYTKYTSNITVDQRGRALFNRTVALTNGGNATLTPFTLLAAGTTYDNFWDCYKNLKNIDAQLANSNPNYQKKAANISEGLENFARDAEAALNCNGICYYGLFFYFQKINVGPPYKNCIKGLQDAFGSKPLGIGILLLVSFALTVITHITSWAICCRCCAPKDSKEKENNEKFK
jgi:hypothetical protein